MNRHRLTLAAAAVVVSLGLVSWDGARASVADTLPERLTGEQYWQLITSLSEPNGAFRSDNLVSNEIYFQTVLPDLVSRVAPGMVYLGVGPEQNFTYIAALRPKMAFITDIRRGNLHTHLMYKALFELSSDRADFISRLFTKPRPDGLTTESTAAEIMNAFWDEAVLTGGPDAFEKNAKAMLDRLTVTHGLPLSDADRQSIIQDVYYNFYWFGPSITYNSSTNNRGNFVSFHDLMVATDDAGRERSFLASEDAFRFLQSLHRRNLLVPVVGDFAGPKALRAVGQWVRDRGATIGAFYLSNVEQYLNQDGIWRYFCANAASLPLDAQSTFIRSSSQGRGGFGRGRGLVNSLAPMLDETRGCAAPAR
jgi:hypothetical protein